jgi:uncharacterized phage protein gp47/JayE
MTEFVQTSFGFDPTRARARSIVDALTPAQAVRPLGILCGVFPPTIIFADVSMQIRTADGNDHNNTVVAQVAAAVATNSNSLGLGNSLQWSVIASWAYAVPGVIDAASLYCTQTTGDGLLQ